MSNSLQEFIGQNLPVEGVVAWGARLPNLTLASHCYDNRLPANRVDQAVSRLALAAECLGEYGIKPILLCWKFELAAIHFAIRPDGACLALFLEKNSTTSTEQIQARLEKFLALKTI
jgi:hypothetical protein